MFLVNLGAIRSVSHLGPAALLAALLAFPAAAPAAPPRVAFDASTTVECVDVTPDDFALAYPQDMVIEARFRVSILLEAGSESDVEDVTITLASPKHRLRVADYAPRTLAASDFTGQIETTSTTEVHRSAEASLKGVINALYGPAVAQATPSAGAAASQHRVTNETFRKLPAKNLVVASGTVHGEAGAFFRLKRSSQAPLEGTREYVLLLVVPRGWRGDWMTLTCQARSYAPKLLLRKLEECGQVQRHVGLYLAGDDVARQAAFRLADSDSTALDVLGRLSR